MPTAAQRPLSLAGLAVEPGQRAAGWLAVSESWKRCPEAVPVAIVHGREPGPVLYVQAVSDGDELNGLRVVQALLARLQPDILRGAVVAVPVANPGAFAAGLPADPRDGRKLNRCFPGQPEGSVTERLAHALFHELVLACDLVLDLHQNGSVPMVPEVRVRTGRRGPKHAECLELAMAFGLPHILDQQGPAGQLARAAPARGIPAVDPELGGNQGIAAEAVELGLRGVWNVLRRWDMVAGEPESAEPPFIARGLLAILAPAGGVVDWRAQLGQRVAAGQPVAQVVDVFGESAVEVVAPGDGVLWSRHPEAAVARGATLGAVGVRHEAG
jgi:predicted deacylase